MRRDAALQTRSLTAQSEAARFSSDQLQQREAALHAYKDQYDRRLREETMAFEAKFRAEHDARTQEIERQSKLLTEVCDFDESSKKKKNLIAHLSRALSQSLLRTSFSSSSSSSSSCLLMLLLLLTLLTARSCRGWRW
jgi:hypothetical protein